MNRLTYSLCIFISLMLLSCNKSLTLVCSESAMVINDDAENHQYTNRNFGSNPRIMMFAWTTQGMNTFGRSFLKFDLSKISAHKTIKTAILKLYGDNTVPNEVTTRLNDKSNAFWVQKVTGVWDENSISWINQPTAASEYQAIAPVSSKENGAENYIIDVTELINSIRMENNGIMLRLQQEEYYSRVSLASDNAKLKKSRPVLIITYK